MIDTPSQKDIFIDILNSKPYSNRVSLHLKSKLINGNDLYFHGVIHVIDVLEGITKPRIQDLRVDLLIDPLKQNLKGELIGYKHVHYQHDNEPYALANISLGLTGSPDTFQSIDDLKNYKEQHNISSNDMVENLLKRRNEGRSTQHWLLFVENSKENYYLDTSEHVKSKSTEEINLKNNLDNLKRTIHMNK
ncbi:hypothetical protein [Entomomonas asaccharolytica]|uniref:Uncharacterized protein n=1 Tax=Entomomonas asaccharolytica TaxID=2785331 RepID=A0A974RXM1_9GAMM|nr:hypothetical protein [Entomomonas asaccharolytica]QQP84994.1 hypothetical protein JHT90_11430 [Entomomonas asaccharolytica]